METPRAYSRGFIGPKWLLMMDDDYDDEHLPGCKCFITHLYYLATAALRKPQVSDILYFH
jgi:hypothetical protein